MTALYEVPVEPPVVSEPPAAELRSVSKWYGANRVLDEVSLRVKRGEIVALVGRSGSGKSTILRVLSGIAGDFQGEREVQGAPAVAFQEPRLFPWRSVRDNVRYGLTRAKLSRAEALSRADQALDEDARRDGYLLEASLGRDWVPVYEVSPSICGEDAYRIANIATYTDPHSLFRQTLLVTLTTEETRNILLGNRLTIRDRNGTVTRQEFDAPAIETALIDVFGLPLDGDWRRITARVGGAFEASIPTT